MMDSAESVSDSRQT